MFVRPSVGWMVRSEASEHMSVVYFPLVLRILNKNGLLLVRSGWQSMNVSSVSSFSLYSRSINQETNNHPAKTRTIKTLDYLSGSFPSRLDSLPAVHFIAFCGWGRFLGLNFTQFTSRVFNDFVTFLWGSQILRRLHFYCLQVI